MTATDGRHANAGTRSTSVTVIGGDGDDTSAGRDGAGANAVRSKRQCATGAACGPVGLYRQGQHGTQALSYTASATDTIDGAVAVSCTPVSGAPFPFGATTVTCTATDSHANIGTRTFTVT